MLSADTQIRCYYDGSEDPCVPNKMKIFDCRVISQFPDHYDYTDKPGSIAVYHDFIIYMDTGTEFVIYSKKHDKYSNIYIFIDYIVYDGLLIDWYGLTNIAGIVDSTHITIYNVDDIVECNDCEEYEQSFGGDIYHDDPMIFLIRYLRATGQEYDPKKIEWPSKPYQKMIEPLNIKMHGFCDISCIALEFSSIVN